MTKPALYYFVLVFCLFGLLNNSFADDKALYQYYPPSAEGTGKVYMGREIAHIMGYQGAAWLERENREKEERTDVLIKSLNLQKGMVIADVGAGTGYLSRRMADSVGKSGAVYATDVQPEMIAKLKSFAKNYPNVKPVLSETRQVNLAANTLDMAIMVDVYHELEYPYEVVQSIITALKPNGKLVLVEYRAESDSVPIKQTHKMTEAQVIKELTVHPLTWEKTIETLPWQHVVIFSKSVNNNQLAQ
jgi:2-polyprenyl-3-methyl-5-hydroxy-6-metoxy-1,4-benzoquinol methylase